MSKLQAIKAKLAALVEEKIITNNEVKFGAVKTDKAVLEWDNSIEDLTAGIDVFVVDEEGNRKPAENGEYTTEDGKVIVVEDGKVASITDPVAEVDSEETPVEEEKKDEVSEETPTEVEKAEEVENPDGGEEPTPDAVEELRKEVDELYKIVDSILEKIGESRKEADERFAKIEKMSMAEPIESTVTITEEDFKKRSEMFSDWRKI